MNQKRTILGYWKRFGVGTLLALLIFAGCTSDDFNPLGPDSPGITADAENADAEVLLKKKSDTDSSSGAVTQTKRISAGKSGTLNLKTDNGVFRYQLKIPKGALSQDTDITMTVPDPNLALIILEPHGIQFNKPVQLKMEIKTNKVAMLDPDTDSDQTDPVDIYWYNEIKQSWEAQGAKTDVDVKKHKIKAEVGLNHFSRYMLGGDMPIQKMMYEAGWGVDVNNSYYYYW